MANSLSLRTVAGLVTLGLVSIITFAAAAQTASAGGSQTLLKKFDTEFVEITPGKGKFPATFAMGSDKGDSNQQPVHEVTFKYSFAIGCYEVPQDLYKAVMGSNPSVWGGPRNSVEMLSWQDANSFCRKATLLMKSSELLKNNEEIRLPTEAEWEYCCRASTKTEFSFGPSATKPGDLGNSATVLDAYGWHTGNASGNDPPVGALKPNAWGLYDMHGYLWEYVTDGFKADYSGVPTDGSAVKGGTRRVIRGGSWRDHHSLLRSSVRRSISEHAKSDAIGFRCVKAKVRK